MIKQGRRKLVFLIRNSGYITTMTFLFLVLGLIFSVQYKNYSAIKKSGISASRQLNELVLLLKQTQSKKISLEKQLEKTKSELTVLNNSSHNSELANDQVKKLYDLAGLTEISGEGINIKLNEQTDHQKLDKSGLINNDGLVHSEDLLKIVNELKSSGAKAISINNQRIITTSEITTAGANVIVNQTKIFSPYVIKAVGPSETMFSAMQIRGGIIEYIEVFGIDVDIQKSAKIVIPAYSGAI